MYKFKLNTAKYRTLKTLIHVRSLSPLLLILAALAISCNQNKGGEAMAGEETSDGGYVLDDYGAIIRGDLSEKNIALVFTGDTFADGRDRGEQNQDCRCRRSNRTHRTSPGG